MHDNIITQNIKLIDVKIIIDEIKFEEICNSFLTYGLYNKKTSNAFIEEKTDYIKRLKHLVVIQSLRNL